MAKTVEERRAYQREYYHRKKAETGQYYKVGRAKYYSENKEAYAERSRKWYASEENKILLRNKKFGIDLLSEIDKQDGLCAIGGEPLPQKISDIHPDHDHQTGVFRGLLCRAHNVGIGMFNDDFELIEKAAKYVFDAKVRYINGY